MSTSAPLHFASASEFVSLLGGVYEHSPWVAERAYAHSPFPSLASLIATMRSIVDASSVAERIDLLRAHPVLAGKEASTGTLTANSHSEQKGVGLLNLDPAEKQKLDTLNREYRERHGFPFVICVRNYTRDGIFEELQRRVGNGTDEELRTAIAQVHDIAEKRIVDVLGRAKSVL